VKKEGGTFFGETPDKKSAFLLSQKQLCNSEFNRSVIDRSVAKSSIASDGFMLAGSLRKASLWREKISVCKAGILQ
jgi:hypothetical protein